MIMSSPDRLGKLILQLTEGLKPFVEMRLKAVYKLDWTDYAKAEWRDGALQWDLSGLFGTIIEQWNPVFSQSLRLSDRDLVHVLREYRNSWACQGAITTEDAYRAYDSAERLLRVRKSITSRHFGRSKQRPYRYSGSYTFTDPYFNSFSIGGNC